MPWQHHSQSRPEPSAPVEAPNAPESMIPLEAIDATNAVLSKYEPVLSIIPRDPQQKQRIPERLDVIQAEKIGISCFRAYQGVIIENGEPSMLFSARLQVNPSEVHIIRCPKSINIPELSPHKRGLLQIQLDAARDFISRNDWSYIKDKYKIEKDDCLKVEGDCRIDEESTLR